MRSSLPVSIRVDSISFLGKWSNHNRGWFNQCSWVTFSIKIQKKKKINCTQTFESQGAINSCFSLNTDFDRLNQKCEKSSRLKTSKFHFISHFHSTKKKKNLNNKKKIQKWLVSIESNRSAIDDDFDFLFLKGGEVADELVELELNWKPLILFFFLSTESQRNLFCRKRTTRTN